MNIKRPASLLATHALALGLGVLAAIGTRRVPAEELLAAYRDKPDILRKPANDAAPKNGRSIRNRGNPPTKRSGNLRRCVRRKSGTSPRPPNNN
jgi:hypothetical protein